MPNSTFFKLPKQKQNSLKKGIMNLFISREYCGISIRDIVRELNISIGSFYKYFKNKDEMYLHFFYEIEEKILKEDKRLYKSFFYPSEPIDLSKILTQEEIDFNLSWLGAPESVLYKFYFGGYSAKLNNSLLTELIEMEEKKHLNKNISPDLAFHIIITSMFSFMVYIRGKKITDRKKVIELKKNYYEKTLLKGILSDNYYKALYK